MEPLCQPCLRGPGDVAGHFDLMVQSIGDRVLFFKCTSCHALWSRTSRTTGAYDWEPIGGSQSHAPATGVIVPPLSDAYYYER